MADHARKQIRDQVVSDLTGLATTGVNVFPTREYPLEDSELPCLLIYTTDEASDIDAMTRPRGLDRNLDLVIEGVAVASANVEDILDTIDKEIETVLGNSLLGGLVKDLFLSTTTHDSDGEGKKLMGTTTQTWVAQYRTVENAPTAAV